MVSGSKNYLRKVLLAGFMVVGNERIGKLCGYIAITTSEVKPTRVSRQELGGI